MEENDGTIWSFVDLFMLICIAFLLAIQMEPKESMESDLRLPMINIFLEETGEGYGIKCNGRYVEENELSKIVLAAFQEGIHKVEVAAIIEDKIPYGFIDNVMNLVRSLGTTSKDPSKRRRVQWTTKKLINYSEN